ncbi:hypothetical protein FJU30_14415 [Affinibrenneria salicis]|uniref:Uncharacterized protein n=2 Tax=Affinibrenneria salicis TaxID=2590031 RepID=A0A5J5FY36_9GAMM|nr:hypothetical protein FJU30_14415 [Affinibrenneria salicis]
MAIGLCLSLTGCAEMLWGVICVGGIIINPSNKYPTTEFPDATVSQPYSELVELGQFYGFEHYSYDKERVPPGFSLTLLVKNKNDEWLDLNEAYRRVKDEKEIKNAAQNKQYQREERVKLPDDEEYKLWVKLSGIATTSGKYKINIIYPSQPSMCGMSDNIYPLRLKVVKPASE